MLGQLDVSQIDFHRVVKIEAAEPKKSRATDRWVAELEIHQSVPNYFAEQKFHHKTPLVTVHKLTFFFNEEPDWQAGVIYEVPTNE